MKTILTLISILLLFTHSADAEMPKASPFSSTEDGLKICIAEGRALLGYNMTRSETEAIAFTNAKREALEQAGVLMEAKTTLYNGEIIHDMISSTSRGLIVEEKPLEKGWFIDKGGHPIFRVKLKAYIKLLEIERRGDLKVLEADVFEAGKGKNMFPKSPVFYDSSEIQIKMKVNSDAYTSIFSVDQNGRIIKLYPNRYIKQNLLPAHTAFIYPDDDLRANGIKVRVKTPKNLNKTLESVLVIATKKNVDFLADKIEGKTTITDLMGELSEINPSFWAQKTIGYEVRK